jgi:23S rRNA-/tRNA-specific pseudouridylate synthase
VDRLYLHATRLEFEHPVTGALVSVESPLPREFAALFD